MNVTGKSIIIISNSSRLCKSLRVLLKSNPGFHCIAEVPNQDSGVKWISKHNSDIVFIDTALPNDSAWKTLKQIKDNFPFCRSVLLAHSAFQENKALNAKADAVLSEDFSTEELFQVLESIIKIQEDSDVLR